ncbi:MAG TPA: alpha/beta hydrolase [Beijerinckiaceae bacterium]|jgi:pimeloyl-ACP methyl ester carboxylesterase|nr:alpha/beta hydrolase [Beijerinckiaceae bacterium]
MHIDSGGSGEPTLVLLHGLGANAGVWQNLLPLIEKHWPGRWMAPDLPGHGRSPAASTYSYGAHAAAVAEMVGQGKRVAIIGHSMGGVVGLMLAAEWFGMSVTHVLALGVKLRWSADDATRMASLTEAPVRWFDDRRAAVERYLRVSGLGGLVDLDSPIAAAGIQEESGRFRLAADPRTSSVGVPPIDDLMRAIKAPVHFAAGAADAMVSLDDMRRYDPLAQSIADAGHNTHVERPQKIWQVFELLMASAKATA